MSLWVVRWLVMQALMVGRRLTAVVDIHAWPVSSTRSTMCWWCVMSWGGFRVDEAHHGRF
jgi:hypothetical protein